MAGWLLLANMLDVVCWSVGYIYPMCWAYMSDRQCIYVQRLQCIYPGLFFYIPDIFGKAHVTHNCVYIA